MPIKSTTTTEEEKQRKKESKRIHRTSQNIRIINVFLESLLSESFSSLGVTIHLTTVPISGPAVGAAQILTWVLPPVSAAIRTGVLSVERALSALYVSHRRSVRPVHRVELTCSLYGWWAGLGSSSSATTAPGFQL